MVDSWIVGEREREIFHLFFGIPRYVVYTNIIDRSIYTRMRSQFKRISNTCDGKRGERITI